MPEPRISPGPEPKPFTAAQRGFLAFPSIHVTMLRWACAVRDIVFQGFTGAGQRKRWMAFGKDRAIAFRMSMPSLTTPAARTLTNDKHQTKATLARHGIPVPDGTRIGSGEIDAALAWFEAQNGAPTVVKPIDGRGGKGVTTSIVDADDLIRAMQGAGHGTVVLERFVPGQDHRILVVGGRYVAAIRRHPASVIGDGRSSVRELIAQKNEVRRHNPYAGHKPLSLAGDVPAHLAKAGLTAASVPARGQQVRLRGVSNIALGGDSEDVTDLVHPDFIALAETTWESLPGLAFCGIDLIAQDISLPVAGQPCAVIEVNANADVAMHHFPTIPGRRAPVDVAGAIIDYVFPEQPPAERHALSLTIRGTVQRVGYLTWLRWQAAALGITGYATSREDDALRVHLEGTRAALDEVVRRCATGSHKSKVTAMEYQDCAVEGHDAFTVRV